MAGIVWSSFIVLGLVVLARLWPAGRPVCGGLAALAGLFLVLSCIMELLAWISIRDPAKRKQALDKWYRGPYKKRR